MCGINGVLLTAGPAIEPETVRARVAAMNRRLVHRGPDDEGLWQDPDAGIAFGHRRLAINDLSPLGHQPMVSASGRLVLALNGEIYNFRTLRRDLEQRGRTLRGRSDTEVLLELLALYGVEATLQRVQGMYAFALWDRDERRLTLVRDRLGKKPLYLAQRGGALVFASELKALAAWPGPSPALDQRAVAGYLREGHIAAPACIYTQTWKLPAAHLFEWSADRGPVDDDSFTRTVRRYWSVPAPAADAPPPEARLEQLHTALRQAVAERMIADVPTGLFLSAGVDSSLVAGLMQEASERPIHTYSVGFGPAARHDERAAASAIARHLGTQHTNLEVSPQEALDTVPELPAVFDEPVADFALVSNLLIARHARTAVTVALTGDGGDELFCGYPRYRQTLAAREAAGRLPTPLRGAGRALLGRLAPEPGPRLRRMRMVCAADLRQSYGLRTAHWLHPERLMREPPPDERTAPSELGEPGEPGAGQSCDAETLRRLDLEHYLVDTILVKVDRTSMAAGMEIRSPLLDTRVLERALEWPADTLSRSVPNKPPLRQLATRYFPAALLGTRKTGFGAPIGRWLEGPLREWSRDLLADDRLARQGLLHPARVRAAVARADLGQRVWQQRLWNLLMLQAWLAHSEQQTQGTQGTP